MSEEEKNDFQQQIDAMETPEIQLILEDQRELYSADELRMLIDELEARGDIDPDFRADQYVGLPLDEQEPPEDGTPPLPFPLP